jgi:inorganic pyrophosphatase
LSAKRDHHTVRVIIETPKGSRNKYAFDPTHQVFELKRVLPTGMDFPYDFGFIPSTLAADGDPVDVLVLMEEPAFPGCVLTCRLIGVIEGVNSTGGEQVVNNRLVAIEANNHTFATVKHLDDLGIRFVKELETFFVAYHALDESKFVLRGTGGPGKAVKCVKRGLRKKRAS